MSSLSWSIIIIFIHETLANNHLNLNIQTSKIRNLNDHLTTFQDCLIHLINYEYLDFDPFSVPVVISQYISVQFKTNNPYTNLTEIEAKLIRFEDRRYANNVTEEDAFPLLNRATSYNNWKCSAQMYLLPPDNQSKPELYTEYELRIPNTFSNLWNNWKWLVFNNHPYKLLAGKYHILIATPDYDVSLWSRAIVRFSPSEGPSDILIWRTRKTELALQIEMDRITFLCRLCSKYTLHAFLTINIAKWEELTLHKLQIHIDHVNSINNGVITRFQILEEETKNKSMVLKLEEQLSQAVRSNLITFRNIHKWLNNTLPVEAALYAIASPNCTYGIIKNSEGRGDQNPFILIMNRVIFLSREEEMFSFLTCGGVTLGWINFSGFVSAFDTFSWIFICSFFLGIGIFMSITSKMFFKKPLETGPFYMGFKVLLEQGDDIALNSKQLGYMYWICGPWILTAVVLSNAYKGQNITDLTSPLKKVGIDSFQQLVDKNFTIYTKRPNYGTFFDDPNTENPENKEFFDAMESWYSYGRLDVRGEYQNYLEDYKELLSDSMTKEEFEFASETLREKVSLFPNYEKIISGEITFLDGIRYCNNTAYVGWSNEIDSLELKLLMSNPPGHVSKAKKGLFSKKEGLQMDWWVNHNIIRRLIKLVESGIVNEWRLIHTFKHNYVSRAYLKRSFVPVKALKMTDNVAAVFVILLACIGLIIPVYLFEIRYLMWTWCQKIILFLSLCRLQAKKYLLNLIGYAKQITRLRPCSLRSLRKYQFKVPSN